MTWAHRLKRVFNIDITLCPQYGGQLRVIADVTDPPLIRKILDQVNSRAPPRLPPRRAEPHHPSPHPLCSPCADKPAATGPPVDTIPELPETSYPASVNEPFHREPFARFVSSRQLLAPQRPLTPKNHTSQDRGKDLLYSLASVPDQATMEACGTILSTPEAQQAIPEDEKKVFDMRFIRSYLVDESISDLD